MIAALPRSERSGAPPHSLEWRLYWMQRLLRIKDRNSGRPIPFHMNSAQKHLLRHLSGRDLILKVRQELGFSTALCALWFFECMTTPGVDVAVVIHKQTEDILRKFRSMRDLFWRSIPGPWRPRADQQTKNVLQFPEIGSSYSIFSATPDCGASGTYHRMLWSEFARWQDPGRTVDALLPALAESGQVAIESTGNGYNTFYDWFVSAMRGERARWKAHFYGRRWKDDYSAEWERELREQYDRRQFAQNYPDTWQEAFQASTEGIYSDFLEEAWPKGNLLAHDYNASLHTDAAIDFGYHHPVILWIQDDPARKLSLEFDAWVGRDCLIGELIKVLRGRRYPVRYVYCDPAGDSANSKSFLSDVEELRVAGFNVQMTMAPRWRYIPTGVNVVRRLFRDANGDRHYTLHPERCRRSIEDIKGYRRDENHPDMPVKDGITDHTNDARRYYAIGRARRSPEWKAIA